VPLGTAQIERGVDESNVTEGLWKIPEHPSCPRVVFFRKQPDIVAQPQEPLEQGASLGIAAL
jgi:hypothetical protein